MNVSGAIFFPLEPKKQRSRKKITPDLRLAQGGTVSHYYILVNRKFFGFCRFSDIACSFLFLLNNFPLQSLEYATYSCVKLIRTANELSYRAVFCCKPTLGKFRSLQGTDLSVAVVICLLGLFWILPLNSRCWLIVINGLKRYEVWLYMFIQVWSVQL